MPRYLKEYRQCRITNCTNRIWNGGYVCSTHRSRMKAHGSYDLPSHEGPPSTLNVEKPPEWAAGKCQKHGYLTKEQMYYSKCNGYDNTKNKRYTTRGCRRCALDRNIRKNYGFKGGIDEYEQLAAKQDNKCAICKQPNTSLTNDRTQYRKLAIDHCHKTGKFRGIICVHCNSGLGYFRDSIEYLQSAIDYLKSRAN